MEAAHPRQRFRPGEPAFGGIKCGGGCRLGKVGGTFRCTFPLFTEYRFPDPSFSFLELCGGGLRTVEMAQAPENEGLSSCSFPQVSECGVGSVLVGLGAQSVSGF